MVHDLGSSPPHYAEVTSNNERLYENRTPFGDGLEGRSDDESFPPIEIVDDFYFNDAFADAIDETAGGAREDAFATFTALLERVAYSGGADAADALRLRALLGVARMDLANPGESAAAALLAGDITRRDLRCMIRTERFARQVQGWQGILRGESDDFGPCGAATLDEWASDLVARLLGQTSRTAAIRRELRKLGVAAFGLVANAA